jgi:hypothetical protein
MKLVELLMITQELIDVMGLLPEEGSTEEVTEQGLVVIPEGIDETSCLALLTKFSQEIRDKDVFSEKTMKGLATLKLWPRELNEDPGPDHSELIEEILNYGKLGLNERTVALKKLVKANDLFASMRKTIAGKFDIEEITTTMLNLLGFVGEIPEAPAQPVVKGVTKIGAPAAPAKPKVPGVAPAKREGSVAEYIDQLVQAGITWDELERLTDLEVKKRGMKTHYGKKALISSVQARLKKNPTFLGKLKITENGVE